MFPFAQLGPYFTAMAFTVEASWLPGSDSPCSDSPANNQSLGRAGSCNSPPKLIHARSLFFLSFPRRFALFVKWLTVAFGSDTSESLHSYVCACVCESDPIIGIEVSDLHPSQQFTLAVTVRSSFLLSIGGSRHKNPRLVRLNAVNLAGNKGPL